MQRLNRLVEQRAPGPWPRTRRAGELDQTLFSLAEGLRASAILLWPVIPGSAGRILAAWGRTRPMSRRRAPPGGRTPGATVAPTGQLFPRVEEKVA